MQRTLFLFLSLAAFGAPALAQTPAQPPADPQSPTEQPPSNPTQAPPDTTPTPAVPPPGPSPASKAAEDAPRKLAVGKDSPGAFFNPGLLVQGWFVWDETTRKAATGDVDLSTTTFRLRRVEVAVGGDIIPKFVSYRVMFDPSRVRDTLNTVNAVDAAGAPVPVRTPASALSTLQDAFITIQGPFANVLIGQFKNPISWDGFNSAAKIIMPERAFIANLVGGQRDLGLRIEKAFEKFAYYFGVFNGATQNNFDNNNQKDVALRLEIYPVKGMTIAGMTYDSVGYRNRAGTKDRWEGDFRYESGPFLLQSEFIHNRDRSANGAKPVDSQGYYVALAYLFKDIGSGHWKGGLQPVVRFGAFDPNTDTNVDPMMVAASNFGGNDERMDFEAGLNYYLRNHEMKFQLSYDRQQFDQSAVKPAINEVILNTQVWF
jgi:hypothetical protein